VSEELPHIVRVLLGLRTSFSRAKFSDRIDKALFAPIPPSESWHYSVAHWVEDDPKVGDGAFSSPGAFGFYPWIDASKSYYGVVARAAPNGAWASVQCGRLIRKAWLVGKSQ